MTHGITFFMNDLDPAPTAALASGQSGGISGGGAPDTVTLLVGTTPGCASLLAFGHGFSSSFALLAGGALSAPFLCFSHGA